MYKLSRADFGEIAQIALMFGAIAGIAGLLDKPSWIYGAIVGCLIMSIAWSGPRLMIGLFARCVAPILLGVLCVMVYIYINQNNFVFGYNVSEYLKYARFSDSYKEQFYSAISTLFAIIIALALVKGIEDVDAMKKNLAEEAQGIRSIWNYLKYFEEHELDDASSAARKKLRGTLLRYVTNAWEMRDSKSPKLNQDCLDECRILILSIKPADRDDEIAHQEIIRSLEAIATLHAKRIGAVGGKISNYLKGALWAMSIALVLPFLAEPLCVAPEYIQKIGLSSSELTALATLDFCKAPTPFANPQRASQYFMIFIMVSFFSFLMLMLHDISSPDHGFWRVDMRVFADLRSDLGRDAPKNETRAAAVESGQAGHTAR